MSAGAEHLMATLSEIVGRPVTMGDGTIDTMIEALAAMHQRLRALEPAMTKARPGEVAALGRVVKGYHSSIHPCHFTWINVDPTRCDVPGPWFCSCGLWWPWGSIGGPITVLAEGVQGQGWSE